MLRGRFGTHNGAMTTGAGPKAPTDSGSTSGRWLGRYELLHEIATGGMATVYLGRARGVAGFERVVAIKCCHPHLRGDEEFATMFLDEARLAARIHHPNVVSTLDVGDEEALYLVMEYIEGDRLSGLIKAAAKKGEVIPLPIAARIMADVLSGLHAAHELTDPHGKPLSIVHRDVSPQNVLVGIDGAARITDFGIAKAEARATVTRDGQVKGKMSYMAPEQLGSSNVTRRADIYSAGIVFWESLTGRRLFRAETDVETLNMVLHGVVPKPSKVVESLPPELDAIVQKALERDPEKRYATAADFAEALENAPFKIATGRAVSAYIHEQLGAAIEARRDLVRKLDDHGPPPERLEHSAVRPTATGVHAANLREVALTSSPMYTPPGGAEAPPDLVEPAARRSRGRTLALGLLALALFAGGTFLGLRVVYPPPSARQGPVADLPPPPPLPPARPEVAVVPPMTPEVTPEAAPEVVPAVAPEAVQAPAAPHPTTGVPRRGPRSGARPGPRAPEAGPQTPAAPTPPPTPAPPSTGGGEFRPGAI